MPSLPLLRLALDGQRCSAISPKAGPHAPSANLLTYGKNLIAQAKKKKKKKNMTRKTLRRMTHPFLSLPFSENITPLQKLTKKGEKCLHNKRRFLTRSAKTAQNNIIKYSFLAYYLQQNKKNLLKNCNLDPLWQQNEEYGILQQLTFPTKVRSSQPSKGLISASGNFVANPLSSQSKVSALSKPFINSVYKRRQSLINNGHQHHRKPGSVVGALYKAAETRRQFFTSAKLPDQKHLGGCNEPAAGLKCTGLFFKPTVVCVAYNQRSLTVDCKQAWGSLINSITQRRALSSFVRDRLTRGATASLPTKGRALGKRVGVGFGESIHHKKKRLESRSHTGLPILNKKRGKQVAYQNGKFFNSWISFRKENSKLGFLFPLTQLKLELSKRQGQYRSSGSDYKKRLLERKKCSIFYGNLTKKQFQKTRKQALKSKRKIGAHSRLSENFLALLESRLDVVLCRVFFCETILAARHMIAQGKVAVNGVVTRKWGVVLKPGDVCSIVESERKKTKNRLLQKLFDAGQLRSPPIVPFTKSQTVVSTQNEKNGPVLTNSEVLSRKTRFFFAKTLKKLIDSIIVFHESNINNLAKFKVPLKREGLLQSTRLRAFHPTRPENLNQRLSVNSAICEVSIGLRSKLDKLYRLGGLISKPNFALLNLQGLQPKVSQKEVGFYESPLVAARPTKKRGVYEGNFAVSRSGRCGGTFNQPTNGGDTSLLASFFRNLASQINKKFEIKRGWSETSVGKVSRNLSKLDTRATSWYTFARKFDKQRFASNPALYQKIREARRLLQTFFSLLAAPKNYRVWDFGQSLASAFPGQQHRAPSISSLSTADILQPLSSYALYSIVFSNKHAGNIEGPYTSAQGIPIIRGTEIIQGCVPFTLSRFVEPRTRVNKGVNTHEKLDPSRVSEGSIYPPSYVKTGSRAVYPQKVSNDVALYLQYHSLFQFLRVHRFLYKERSRKMARRGHRQVSIKPLHLEVSYTLLTAVFLYYPQKLVFPVSLDLDLIFRELQS